MRTRPNTTLLIFLGILITVCLAVGAWDVWLLRRDGVPGTISALTLAAARDYPAIPLVVGLAIGLLLGHLFLPQEPGE